MQKRLEEPGFWDDPETSQHVMKELKGLEDSVKEIEQLCSDYEDMLLLIEMSEEEPDEETSKEIEAELETFEATFEELRISTLLTGPYDKDNAIVTLHAGAGGTESCDWAGMLYRMYTRWAEKKGYDVEELDYLEGDVAGIKGVTFEVKGENAYGYLRSEKGVHRLVRISPFNAAGKRQTSFASCDVIPDIEEDIDIEINDDDLKIDTYRSSGAGGQHINKTSSAVRITHLPTGIVVAMQDERSQQQNRQKAMMILRSRLIERQKQAEMAAASDAPASDLISWLGDVQSSGVEVSRAEPEEAGVPTDYLVYVQFATYPLFGGIAAIVSQGLASLRDPDVRRRLGASSVSDGSFRCQTGMAIGFCGVLVWALNGALGFMVYRDALAGVSMGAVLLIQMALLALALVGTGFGFLLWQLGVSHEVAHAVANIASMVLTFLAGTWVSIDQMGPAIESIARLTPGYWCVQGIVRVYEAPRITLDVAADVAACAGVTALFAVAVVSVALALGRVRDREAA